MKFQETKVKLLPRTELGPVGSCPFRVLSRPQLNQSLNRTQDSLSGKQPSSAVLDLDEVTSEICFFFSFSLLNVLS